MYLNIPKDRLLNPIPPRVFLCDTCKKIIGELPATNRNLSAKWNTYSEFSFDIQRTYVDLIDGETKIHPLYDKVEAPRNILVENIAYFCLQDIDDTSSDNDIKSISAFSLEYATSNKYLTNWHINTGEVDSKEVRYNEEQYGIDYNTDQDSFYKLASGDFDPYESYYLKTPTKGSYVYEQVQVADKDEYADYINNTSDNEYTKLYMKKFPNVQFYNNNPSKKGLSLLHLIFENIPDWEIGNVDQALWHKERRFSEDRISVLDFINNDLCETFGCVAVWDSITGTVHFYEELEDDSDIDNKVTTQFETDVFISKENLASEIKVNYSSDDIKTKLVVTGSDNLNISEVNLGRNEIMDLSFYHTLDWMEQDLFEAYDHYIDELQEAQTGLDANGNASDKYPMSYPDAMKGWVSVNNRYRDLINEIPAEGNVVLVGDEFKKLYCTYRAISNAYYKGTINSGTVSISPDQLYSNESFTKKISEPTNSEMYVVQGYHLVYNKTSKMFDVSDEWASKEIALIKHLNLYHVYEDFEAKQPDNILLKLKNSSSDVATIRIYDARKKADSYDERLKYYTKDKDGEFSSVPITFADATDFNTKKNELAEDSTEIWTNDYYIQSVVVKASSGVSEAPDIYPIMRWIKDELTAKEMGLEGYKVIDIGTMGAYFVLAKDESLSENLQDYGIRMLEEKHKTYTTLFQTQTEEMLSQEKSQCIVQDLEPEGDYAAGTRWLDTDSNPVALKEYNGTDWVTISASVSPDDQKNYEKYQRYIDNYEKLVSVQEVLSEKKGQAEYFRDGYSISDRVIVPHSTDGSSLLENMHNAALAHFNGYTVTTDVINSNLPLYTFTTSFDPIVYGKNTKPYSQLETYYIKDEVMEAYSPILITEESFKDYDATSNAKTLYVQTSGHIFAVYLKGTTPYVAYANSEGVYNMIMQYIKSQTEMNKFFTVDQWIRLSPFIKEDEFNDSNFLLNGYESEEESIKICQELMDAADKELKTLCKPSLEFSMTMANILALPEFAPLFDQFQLGNFIKVGIRDGYVKRSRLLEVNIGFDDLSDFSCTFGNLVATKSEVDKHADLLKSAVSAGKQVAKSSGSWQKSVDKINKLEKDIANGLQDMALVVGSASGQAISWDSTGMHFRKYKDGSTTEYEPEEIAIINNALVATNDSWRTSKAAFGKYKIRGEDRWGPVAEYVTADIIEGKLISGGSIEIGSGDKKFVVNEDGSVEIKSGGTNYIDAMKVIDSVYRFQVVLEYTGLTVFSDTENDYCQITCKVYDHNKIEEKKDITSQVIANGGQFTWSRSLSGDNSVWTPTLVDGKPNIILIKHGDVDRNAQFSCSVDFEEDKFNTEGGAS